jgi:hypothetical protein
LYNEALDMDTIDFLLGVGVDYTDTVFLDFFVYAKFKSLFIKS